MVCGLAMVKAENSADLLDLVARVYICQRLEFVWLTGTGEKHFTLLAMMEKIMVANRMQEWN